MIACFTIPAGVFLLLQMTVLKHSINLISISKNKMKNWKFRGLQTCACFITLRWRVVRLGKILVLLLCKAHVWGLVPNTEHTTPLQNNSKTRLAEHTTPLQNNSKTRLTEHTTPLQNTARPDLLNIQIHCRTTARTDFDINLQHQQFS